MVRKKLGTIHGVDVIADDSIPENELHIIKKKRNWYEYITPLLGIKWGAEVTLIAFVGLYEQHSPGYTAAAWIVAVFLVLEWFTIAWKEFKRG